MSPSECLCQLYTWSVKQAYSNGSQRNIVKLQVLAMAALGEAALPHLEGLDARYFNRNFSAVLHELGQLQAAASQNEVEGAADKCTAALEARTQEALPIPQQQQENLQATRTYRMHAPAPYSIITAVRAKTGNACSFKDVLLDNDL